MTRSRPYAYDLNVPERVTRIIAAALMAFEREDVDRSIDLWFHGLPVWVARERAGDRVNRVTIQALVASGRRRLSLTPDAYRDEWGPGGVQSRWLPRDEALKRPVLPYARLQRPAFEALIEQLMEGARHLDLSEKHDIVRAIA